MGYLLLIFLKKWFSCCIYFVSGGVALVWYLVCLILVRNSPLEDNFMSKTEKKFLSLVNPYASNNEKVGGIIIFHGKK